MCGTFEARPRPQFQVAGAPTFEVAYSRAVKDVLCHGKAASQALH
jgi:hypothetical protein